ncbi:MAG: hypothetical protein AMXMBFR57_37040 [Acidimicrobiia bacterium]
MRLAGKDTATVVQALTRDVRTLSHGLMASLTWDRGLELAAHRTFHHRDRCPGVLLRSAEPMAARLQRKHKRLLRQYLSHGTDLAQVSQTEFE